MDGVSARRTRRDQRLDEAARVAWLYFIAGKTQDEIASDMQLSRQAVQRLVTMAVKEKLIHFQVRHQVASCMELAERLTDRFGLELCEVVPTDPDAPESTAGVAIATANRMERLLNAEAPIVLCVGSGRTMRAAVEEIHGLHRPQHKIVALVGSMAADGHATEYDVVMRLADKIGAQRFPAPVPVQARSIEERKLLQSLSIYRSLLTLREQAKASFLGIAEVAWQAPLHRDGFFSDADLSGLIDQGAIGELTGWAFDEEGRLLDEDYNGKIVSLPLETPPKRLTVLVACGHLKTLPLRAALTGRLANGLITDERTADAILSS
ncbi:MAG: sugar-binding transcriptional regulator [Pseudomonadota bacterium]